MIRIVTCIDFDTDDPAIAYAMWRKLTADIISHYDNQYLLEGFESTDEWFNASGQILDVEFVQSTRMQQFKIEGNT